MIPVEDSASVGAQASAQKTVEKRFSVSVVPKWYTLVHRIPACPSCGAANPKGLSLCPQCNEPAPEKTDFRDVDGVLTEPKIVPLHARILLWIGGALMKLADKISRS